MSIVLRPYQKAASDASIAYFQDRKKKGGGLVVVPTGGGKSHIIADIAHRLGTPILIFCPSKEILLQNYEKMEKVAKGESSMYSASVGQKKISLITFATIKSAINHIEDFDVFRFIIIDEAHGVNSDGGMYEKFNHHRADRKVVGLTATPYRLSSRRGGSELKFLTRTRPHIFSYVLYVCQITELLSRGYLADPEYFDLTDMNLENVRSNSTGSDYDDKSLVDEYRRSGFYEKLLSLTLRVLHPKSGVPRKGILVFTRFTTEAEYLVNKLQECGESAAIVTGETPNKERERLIKDFKEGRISVIVNCMVLAVGFDYPELDTIILARPTKSLALYYQMLGRCIRPFPNKKAWCIDIGGTYRRFGRVADLKIGLEKADSKQWAVFSRGRKLTNTIIV